MEVKTAKYLPQLISFRPRTGFDKGSLDRLEQLFRQTVGNEKEIRREDFKKIVISKNVRTIAFQIPLISKSL